METATIETVAPQQDAAPPTEAPAAPPAPAAEGVQSPLVPNEPTNEGGAVLRAVTAATTTVAVPKPAPQTDASWTPAPPEVEAVVAAPDVAAPPPMPSIEEQQGMPRKRSWSAASFDWLPWAMLLACVAGLSVLWLRESTPAEAQAQPGQTVQTAVAAKAAPPRVFDLTTRRWPATFSAPPSQRNIPSASLLTPQTLKEMQVTYGYYLEQDRTASRFGKLYPDVRTQLDSARIRFDQRFHDSLDEIEQRLSQRLVGWEEVRRQLIDAAEDHADRSRFTQPTARAYVAEMNHRAGGELPSPQLEILLAFDPHYLTAPQREYEEGYRRRFSGSGAGKAQGLKVRLEFPRSWVVSDSQGSHVVRLFHSRLTSTEAAAVLVNPMPLTDDADPLRWLVTPAGLREISNDVDVIDAGRIRLTSKNDALWREYRFTRAMPNGNMQFHAVDFSFVHGRQCVCLNFLVGGGTSEHMDRIDGRFARNGPLFKLMAQSVDVLDH